MGKLLNGPYGPYSGKTGPFVGYVLNGKGIIRGLPEKSTKPLTLPRKNNCEKMKILSNVLCNMRMFLHMTFSPAARGTVKNWYNLAIEYNNPKAIKGYYPELEIDYQNVVLSRGSLKQPVNPTVVLMEEAIKFSWEDTDEPNSHFKEHVMLMVYFPHNNHTSYDLGEEHKSTGFQILPIPIEDKGKPFEAYINFVSYDRQDFSDSLYLGSFGGPYPETLQGTPEIPKSSKKKMTDLQKEVSQESIAIARNFKNMGIAIADIAKGTGLSVEMIECL